ncbi:MAG: phosphatidylglycerophosphatase A [Ignavibacteriales bacterium]|nr:phosphatidylglycerophosphatase A [Ignavibacteriales bacterium]
MKINFIENFLGSGFYTGYIPIASGSFASLMALLIYFIPGFENYFIHIPLILIFIFYGIFIGNKFEKKFGKDPAECTIDEVVGMWISLLFLPKSLFLSLIAFLIWRILDIVKPAPARNVEKLKGGVGIMADDIIASTYTLIIMQLLVLIINKLNLHF